MKLLKLLLILAFFMGCKDNGTDPEDNKPLLSGIIPIDNSNQIEVVTWNVERFPKSDFSGFCLEILLEGIGADIYLLQEVSNGDSLAKVVGNLPDYAYFLLSNSTGLKLAIVYNNTVVKLRSTAEILEQDDYYFASRPPLLAKIEWENNSVTKELSLINLHYKCCGDDSIEVGNDRDEEFRRVKANELIYNYINNELAAENVIVAGDWNDAIEEPQETNVFQVFIDDNTNFQFADMDIAQGSADNWSWQGWSSSYPAIHFDHILINRNLFDEYGNNSVVSTIKVEEYFENGNSDYDTYLSDHRPVYLQFSP